MEKVIYNLVFNRKKQLNSEGKALIQVEAYLNQAEKVFFDKGLCQAFSVGCKEKSSEESS